MSVLLVIDMQAALNDPALSERGQRHADANVAALLERWRETGEPVVHLRVDSVDPSAPDAPGSAGHEYLAAARPRDTEIVIDHRTGNTFIGTDLMQVIEDTGAHELVVCGATLQGAVESTVRMAHALGFMVYLPADAIVAREASDRDGRRWSADEVHALTLAILDGAFCQVVTSGALVGSAAAETLN